MNDRKKSKAFRNDFRGHIRHLIQQYKNQSWAAAASNQQQFVALCDRLCAWSTSREDKEWKRMCGTGATVAKEQQYNDAKLKRANKQWDFLHDQKILYKEKLVVNNHEILAMFLVHCIVDIEKDINYTGQRMALSFIMGQFQGSWPRIYDLGLAPMGA